MKIGILGCGAMAETFADTLRKMEGLSLRHRLTGYPKS